MEITIDQIIQAISQMTLEELDQVMTAIEQRLEQLDQPADPNTRAIRQGIRSARSKKRKGGTVTENMKAGMRVIRGGGN